MASKADIPIVILCGGMGMRLKEETEFRPKPMVEVGHYPILWHIMKLYADHGFHRFILCLGFRGDVIRNYFATYHLQTCDTEVVLGDTPGLRILSRNSVENWRITLAETGRKTQTGARIKRIEKYVDTDEFMVTYGDAVTDLDLDRLWEFHKNHGGLATVTGVHPPARFGELEIDGDRVVDFAEKPLGKNWISGGFFIFKKEYFSYLSADENCVMEAEPMMRLAQEGQLHVYQHHGFWQCMDTMRDLTYLRSFEDGKEPWFQKKKTQWA
ncbi:MAG TPA: glucose-1-phosphate cytidylyltransferase [Bryobacteraceae bacterium]|nr:glucose-1-phosphate cytidylyltransferase [Bryobacteraceae bacterium]